MNAFEQQAITVALKKMFSGKYFNICTVDACLKVAGAIPPKQIYNTLNTLHCVDWGDMPLELRQQVFAETLLLFNNTGFALDDIVVGQIGPGGRVGGLLK